MAQILVPTSLFTIQDLKTHTEQTQAHFTILSLIYSPNLSSHSPTFPSATIYIRIFSPSLNNAKACQGTAQVQKKKHHGMHGKPQQLGTPQERRHSHRNGDLGRQQCSHIRSARAGTRVAAASAASAGHSSNGQR